MNPAGFLRTNDSILSCSHFRSKQDVQVMRWTKAHDILLLREVLDVDPYQHPRGSRERASLWEKISTNLDGFHERHQIKFRVSARSVRDRVTLVLIKNYKKKMTAEKEASGIQVGPMTEFDQAMEEVLERSQAVEALMEQANEEKRENIEKEKELAKDIRKQALERVGETKKRKGEEKPRGKRRSGGETMEYLRERSEQQTKIREEEMKMKREAQDSQMRAHQVKSLQQG